MSNWYEVRNILLKPWTWDAEVFDFLGLGTFTVILLIAIFNTDACLEKWKVFMWVVGIGGLLVDGLNVGRWLWYRDNRYKHPNSFPGLPEFPGFSQTIVGK